MNVQIVGDEVICMCQEVCAGCDKPTNGSAVRKYLSCHSNIIYPENML